MGVALNCVDVYLRFEAPRLPRVRVLFLASARNLRGLPAMELGCPI